MIPDRRPESEERSTSLGSSTLDRFADVIGEEAALRLSAHFGGRQLYVPHAPRPDSELVQVIGEECAEALAKHFGGIFYSVPLEVGKRARIVELRKTGEKIRAIAEELGCTERHVYNVLAEYRAGGGSLEIDTGPDQWQCNLFDLE